MPDKELSTNGPAKLELEEATGDCNPTEPQVKTLPEIELATPV
jgi:hypothetical protein